MKHVKVARPKVPRPKVVRPIRRPYPMAVAAVREFCAPRGLREPRDVDVPLLAMEKGAVVVPGPCGRGEGHLLRGRRRSLIVIREDLYGTLKGTFVAGHELTHLLCHHALDELPICTGEARATPGTRRIEGEASDGSSELLMPEAWFAPAVTGCATAPTLADLEAMAAHYRVPLEAAALRALLWVNEPCALVVAEHGRVAWCAYSEGWSVYVHRKAPLPEGTGAARVAGERVRGAAWGEQTRGAVEVTEHAVVSREAGDATVVAWLVQRRA